MKKNFKYWLLILLSTNSLNLLGQKNDTLKLGKSYSNYISLKDFIKELSQDTNFNKLKLVDTILVNAEKADKFKDMPDDDKIHLDFLTSITKGKDVSKMTIETVLSELEKNRTFRDSLVVRLRATGTPQEKKNIVVSYTAENILKILNTEEHKIIKEEVVKKLNENNFILNHWEKVVGLLSIACIVFFTLYLKKHFSQIQIFKSLNIAFFPDKSKIIVNQHDIIDFLQVKSKNQTNYLEDENWKYEKKVFEEKLTNSERQLKRWIDLSNGESPELIKVFLQEKGFYQYTLPKSNNQIESDDSNQVYYFSSVNRDGDLGIFQDENKTHYKEPDSIYKFEVKKSNKNEANFWFDASNASNASNALSYRSYMIDPFCISKTSFFEGCSRIIHEEKGVAKFENGRWVVSLKAIISYK
jgi:hypothetical protein